MAARAAKTRPRGCQVLPHHAFKATHKAAGPGPADDARIECAALCSTGLLSMVRVSADFLSLAHWCWY